MTSPTTPMREALKELLAQVESLEGYALTRDMPPHEAQACLDEAIRRAKDALSAQSETVPTEFLFGKHDEPLNDYGKRLVRVILSAAEQPSEEKP